MKIYLFFTYFNEIAEEINLTHKHIFPVIAQYKIFFMREVFNELNLNFLKTIY